MLQITYDVDQHNSYQDLTNIVLTMEFPRNIQEQQTNCISITSITSIQVPANQISV